MTSTQYQRLGRAVELMTELAGAVEELRQPHYALVEELSKAMPNEQANAIVRAIMCDCCPTLHLGDRIVDVVNSMKVVRK